SNSIGKARESARSAAGTDASANGSATGLVYPTCPARSRLAVMTVVRRGELIPMRDGVELCADVFLPDGAGSHPASLAMRPSGKEIQSLPVPAQPLGFAPWARSPVYNRSIEAGDPAYLTANGYVHVIPDLRGIGRSGGEYRGWLSEQEAQDGYDLI